jgi:hypothetical protein
LWTIASDTRSKRNIRPFEGGIEIIRQLNPTVAEYNGKCGTPEGERVVSFDPEELRAVLPQCVLTVRGKLNPNDENETDIYGINKHEVHYHMLRAIQQIDKRLQKIEGTAHA